MLDLALKANLPIVAVETDDTVNLSAVLSFIAGEPVGPIKLTKEKILLSKRFQYVIASSSVNDKLNYDEVYTDLGKKNRTLVVVNPKEIKDVMFNAGIVPVPQKMLHEFLESIADDTKQIPIMATVLGGLSLKAVGELCMLAMAEFHALTSDGLSEIRRRVYSSVRGVQQVDTHYLLYTPDKEVELWVKREGKIFRAGGPQELMPRGLLFDGKPGTGKTMGAKYLANELNVPLFKLDMMSMYQKYVGESETNMRNALATVEQSSPCVLLIDEVEKLFTQKGGDSDSGVSTRMLSSILWWLQEHRRPIITIMTTNNRSKLPPELFRPGRIDKVLVIQELKLTAVTGFATQVIHTYEKKLKLPMKLAASVHAQILEWVTTLSATGEKEAVSQAVVTAKVVEVIKDEVVKTL